jgi:hypothetical protein
LAPIAPGTVKPIVLKPPDVMCVRGARVTQFCLTMLWGSPAPVTTMASGWVACWISKIARAWVMGTRLERSFLRLSSSQAAFFAWISSK